MHWMRSKNLYLKKDTYKWYAVSTTTTTKKWQGLKLPCILTSPKLHFYVVGKYISPLEMSIFLWQRTLSDRIHLLHNYRQRAGHFHFRLTLYKSSNFSHLNSLMKIKENMIYLEMGIKLEANFGFYILKTFLSVSIKNFPYQCFYCVKFINFFFTPPVPEK